MKSQAQKGGLSKIERFGSDPDREVTEDNHSMWDHPDL